MDLGTPHSGTNCVRLSQTYRYVYTFLKTDAPDKAPIPISYKTGI